MPFNQTICIAELFCLQEKEGKKGYTCSKVCWNYQLCMNEYKTIT